MKSVYLTGSKNNAKKLHGDAWTWLSQNAWKIELPIWQCDVLGDILQKFGSQCRFRPTTLETLRSALYTHIYYAFITEWFDDYVSLCCTHIRKTCANGSKVWQRTFIDRSDETSIAFITFTAINRNVNAYANWRYFTCETTYHESTIIVPRHIYYTDWNLPNIFD